MQDNLISTASEIVSVYLSSNSVHAGEVSNLLADVHRTLVGLAQPKAAPVASKPEPLMPWKKTIHQDYLISLEDGKKYKTLKRHLGVLGITPDEYREKWNLPADYPLVCKAYSYRRSELAQAIGLGRKISNEAETVAEPLPRTETKADKPEVEKTNVAEPQRASAEASPAASKKKAAKKVTPHPKPKDRAKPASKRAKDNSPPQASEGTHEDEEAGST